MVLSKIEDFLYDLVFCLQGFNVPMTDVHVQKVLVINFSQLILHFLITLVLLVFQFFRLKRIILVQELKKGRHTKNCTFSVVQQLREAAKKGFSLNGWAFKALPPAPLGLNSQRTFFQSKNSPKQILTFFSAPNFWTKITLFFGKYLNNPDKMPTDKL